MKMWCSTCQSFYTNHAVDTKGTLAHRADKFIVGTTCIKKVNFKTHVNSRIHKEAIVIGARLSFAKMEATMVNFEAPQVAKNQPTLHPFIKKLSKGECDF